MKRLITVVSIAVIFMALVACRNDEEQQVRVESIKFAESEKSIAVGEVVAVGMSIMPEEAKPNVKVEYSVTQQGIVAITSYSNDGVVFEALSRGSTVIIGKADGMVDYLSITVVGDAGNLIPHIIAPVQVLEVPLNQRRSITVSLAGGSPLDNSGFIWSLNGQRTISMESTANVCVFDTIALGEAVITVAHPRASYTVDILVYVLGIDEVPVYLTTNQPVITMERDSIEKQIMVELRGGNQADYDVGYVWEIKDGRDVVQLTDNQRIGTIRPLKSGTALIEVSHRRAAHRLKIQVIVNEKVEYNIVNIDKTFLLLGVGEHAVVRASFSGTSPSDVLSKYRYELTGHDIVDVLQTDDHFSVITKASGMATMKIYNSYADFPREVLIVVGDSGSGIADNQKYITTSQNVVMMEVGQGDTLLKMLLVGGNEADRNGFTWWVDRSDIVDLEAAGTVKKDQTPRTITQGVLSTEMEAIAVLTPKISGTARIYVQHGKARNEAMILVKVYPRGTFATLPVVLSGPAHIRIAKGTSADISLSIETGKNERLGQVNWSLEGTSVATVDGAGLSGTIQAKEVGVTRLTVSGGNLRSPYSAVVAVYAPGEEPSYIFTDNPYVHMEMGQSIMVQVENRGMSAEDFAALVLSNSNASVVRASISRGAITLSAVAKGTAELVVSGNAQNQLRIVVYVEDPQVNVNYPYYMTVDRNIVGIVNGSSEILQVNLVGGGEREYNSLVWSSSNEQVAQVISNGRTATVNARGPGQAVVRVSHPKSVNQTLEIVVYVANNSIAGKVVLYAEQSHYFIERGERVYITLRTNANESQRNTISWQIDGDEFASITYLGDKASVLVEGVSEGVARITASHVDNVVSQSIYVSVVERRSGSRYIGVPSILEAVVGNNISINAVAEGLSDDEIAGIRWTVDNDSIASVVGAGLYCLVQPKQSGMAIIKVSQQVLGFEKELRLYVYSSYEEMANSYVMSFDTTYYRVSIGDEFDASLVFGTKGFPDYELANIRWTVSEGGVASVSGFGKKVTVKALSQGIAVVTASSSLAKYSTVSFQVEVTAKPSAGDGLRLHVADSDRMKGIVIGRFADIGVKLYRGLTEVPLAIDDMKVEVAGNSGLLTVTKTQNNVRLTARQAGEAYVVISHELAEDIRLFVWTGSEADVNNYFPIMFDTNNYLLKTGDVISITAKTSEIPEKISKMSWRNETNSGAVRFNEVNSREIRVTANQKGSDVIAVLYDGTVVQRLYISVTENVSSDFSGYIITENIIGLVMGSDKVTRLTTNLPQNSFSSIRWSSENQGIVRFVEYSGLEATLRPVAVGQTFVNVKIDNIERKILVFVCESESDFAGYKAANIDNRYHVISKGNTVSISLFTYDGTVQGQTEFRDHLNYGNDYSGVVSVATVKNGTVKVSGLNEGIAAIRVTNAYYGIEIVVYVEVHSRQQGSQGNTSSEFFMTARQTLYILEMGGDATYVGIDVIGDNFTHYGMFDWTVKDPSIIDLSSTGIGAYVTAKKEGTTTITIDNPECINSLEILIIVGERYSYEGSTLPYIWVSKSIFELGINDTFQTLSYELRNMPNSSNSDVVFDIEGSSVTVNTRTIGFITANPIAIGLTKVTLSAGPGVLTEIYFIVRQGEATGSVYLTTSENFVIGGLNDIRLVNVRLVGHTETDSNNFRWSIKDESIARVVGNGNVGSVYGIREGETVITVSHAKIPDEYSLQINLKISSNRNEQAVYLTTQTNVMEAVATNVAVDIYIQKIGGNPANRKTTWSVDDPTVVSVTGSEYTGMFTPKKAGIAKITITNEEIPLRPLNIVVIVREPSGTGMYIAMPTTLVMLRPGTLNYRATASLVGGNESDNRDFVWTIHHQEPANVEVAQAQGNVVTIVPSGNQCNINAIYDGVARIRVSHKKSDIVGYLTVQVTRHNELSFKRVSIELEEGESQFVALDVPTYDNFREKILFSSDNNDVAIVMGVSGTALVQAKAKGNAIIRAWIAGKEQVTELFVNVVEDHNPMVTRIITAKTSYSFNPRSPAEKIQAELLGLSVIDSMNDDLRWYPSFLNPDEPELLLFPQATMQDSNGAYHQGRELQVSPSGHLGMATITIGHQMIDPKYWKTVIIIVNEHSDALTLDKEKMLIQNDTAQNLRATIIGGRQSDYDQIVWIAEWLPWNAELVELVRIMGTGREVLINPMGGVEGTVLVTAIYGMHMRQCVVTVEAGRIFSLEYRSLRLYPGEEFPVKYRLRPPSATVRWDGGFQTVPIGSTDPRPRVAELTDHVIDREVMVRALVEGETEFFGVASQNAGAIVLSVFVAYDYDLIPQYSVHGMPMVNPGDPPITFDYIVRPPTARVQIIGAKPESSNAQDGLLDRVVYTIGDPDINTGKGTITMPIYEEGVWDIELQLIDVDGNPMEDAKYKKKTRVTTSFDNEQLTPFFYRYLGTWSNRSVESYQLTSSQLGHKPAAMRSYSSMTIEGSERENMFFLQGSRRDNSSQAEKDQLIKNVYWPASGAGNSVTPNDVYLVLGDGDDHMILFDRRYATSTSRIEVKVDPVNVYTSATRWYDNEKMVQELQKYGVVLTEPVTATLNGVAVPGIRLSGGIDQILYDRVAFDRRLFVDLQSNNVQSDSPSVNITPIKAHDKIVWITHLDEPRVAINYLDTPNSSRPDRKHRFLSHRESLKLYTETEYQDIRRNPENASYMSNFIAKAAYHEELAANPNYGSYAWVSVTSGSNWRASYTAINTATPPESRTVTGLDVSSFEYYKWGYMYNPSVFNNPDYEEIFARVPLDSYQHPSGSDTYYYHTTYLAGEEYETSGVTPVRYYQYRDSNVQKLLENNNSIVFNEAEFSKNLNENNSGYEEESQEYLNYRTNILSKILDSELLEFNIYGNSNEDKIDFYRYSTDLYELSEVTTINNDGESSWDVFGPDTNNNRWSGSSLRLVTPTSTDKKTLNVFNREGTIIEKPAYLQFSGINTTVGTYHYDVQEVVNYKLNDDTRANMHGAAYGLNFFIFQQYGTTRAYVHSDGQRLSKDIDNLGYYTNTSTRKRYKFSVTNGYFAVAVVDVNANGQETGGTTHYYYRAGNEVSILAMSRDSFNSLVSAANSSATARINPWDYLELREDGNIYIKPNADLSVNGLPIGSYVSKKTTQSMLFGSPINIFQSESQRYSMSIRDGYIVLTYYIPSERWNSETNRNETYYRQNNHNRYRGDYLFPGWELDRYEWVTKKENFKYRDASYSQGNPRFYYNNSFYSDGQNSQSVGRVFLNLSGERPYRRLVNLQIKSGGFCGGSGHSRHLFDWGWYGCNRCNQYRECLSNGFLTHGDHAYYWNDPKTYERPLHKGNVIGENGIDSYVILGKGAVGDRNSPSITTNWQQYVLQKLYYEDFSGHWGRSLGGNSSDWSRDYTWSKHKDVVNTDTTVKLRTRWDRIDGQYVVPISLLTQFPFEVDVPITANGTETKKSYYTLNYGDQYGYKNPITDVTSRPMPSINTVPRNNSIDGSNSSQQILVKLKVTIFYFDRSESFNIWVDYKVRDSHHLYSGKVGDKNGSRNYITGADTQGEYMEIQGRPVWGTGSTALQPAKDIIRDQEVDVPHTYREDISKAFLKVPVIPVRQ